MKRIIETSGEGGFDSMLGEKILVMCAGYFYTGVLAGVNDDHIELSGASIVYETGSLVSDEWKCAEDLPGCWRVQLSHIESWGVAKC